MKWLLVSIVLIAAHPAWGGPDSALEDSRSFIARADSLRDLGQSEQALSEADSLIGELGDDPHARAILERTRGLMLAALGRFEDAEASYRLGLESAEVVEDAELLHEIRLKLAWVLDRRGNTAAADSLALLVRDEADRDGLAAPAAQARLQIGRRHLLSGRFDAAEIELRASIDYYDNSDNLRSAGDSHNLMGIVMANTLRLDEAIEEFEYTRDIAERSGNNGLLARSLNNLGYLSFQLGDPHESSQYFQAAYELQQSIGSVPNQILSGLNVAESATRLGHHEEANALLLILLEQSRTYEQRDYEIGALTNLGDNELRRGRNHASLERHREAQRLARDLDRPVELLRGILGEARALSALDSVLSAVELLAREAPTLRPKVPGIWALQIDADRARYLAELDRWQDSLEIQRQILATAHELGLENFLLPAQVQIASCHRHLAAADSALHWYRIARTQWESLRKIPLDPEWRERRAAQAKGFHTQLAILELEHGADDGEEAIALAYDSLQRYKARTLLERVRAPGWTLDETSASDPLTLAELQDEVLRDGERFLDFYAGSQESLLFSIDRDGARVHRLAGSEELESKLELLTTLLADPDSDEQTLNDVLGEMGEELFGSAKLWPPPGGCVLFSPDGPLHRLPLAALKIDGAPLGERWELVRVPSSSLLASLRRRDADPDPVIESVLAIVGADIVDDDLPAAHREVRRLASEFENVQTLWAGAEGVILDNASLGGHQIVHFAGHALVRDDNPWRSGLVLSGFGASGTRLLDNPEARLLRADRIAGMQLESSLVFLAACESATGETIAGEGVVGLTAAFLSAGVGCVVATLWPVEDEAASIMVHNFYDALADGESVASSLRSAQSRARADARISHPRHWAGYVVIGDASTRLALQRRPTGASPLLLAIVSTVFLIIIGGWMFRRSRNSL